ncbi:hypothetical protein AVEN_1178-1 [Araneus ventricosus]|uniref:Uncharacterized protein n=1 Tax=Araneus ventricosus TaxID=182803 RepID=A0A4Y2EFE2_ARAVE|nr:hypothetical protein AVEN_1178-1 [Araneus ventricosus]
MQIGREAMRGHIPSGSNSCRGKKRTNKQTKEDKKIQINPFLSATGRKRGARAGREEGGKDAGERERKRQRTFPPSSPFRWERDSGKVGGSSSPSQKYLADSPKLTLLFGKCPENDVPGLNDTRDPNQKNSLRSPHVHFSA